ncbi:MAG: hypothetical protein ACKVZH_26460 [Blastocatellia bacterium]
MNQSKPTGAMPARLVQIEGLRKSSDEALQAEINIPALTERQIFQKKSYIAFRKIIGFFHTTHSYGATRRWLFSHVLPDKVLYRWKPYLQGECNRCGACCKIVFTCSFYHESEGSSACSIYTSEKHAPTACVTFPFDPTDLDEVKREILPGTCPFYFEGQPEHPTTWGAVKAEIRAGLGKRVDKLKEIFEF